MKDITKQENKNIYLALLKVHEKIHGAKKTGKNDRFKKAGKGSPYFQLDDLYEAYRRALIEEGLLLFHEMDMDERGKLWLITYIVNTAGEKISSRFPLIVEKQDCQGYGSARTYACRYSLCNLLSIPEGRDDDGNAACVEKINAKQIKTIQTQFQQYKDKEERWEFIKEKYQIKTLKQIPAAQFSNVLSTLKEGVTR